MYASHMTAYNEWLNTYISEKEINTEHVFTIETDGFWGCHIIPVAVVIELLHHTTNPVGRELIRHTLTMLDITNRDPMDYLRHLAQGLAEAYDEEAAEAQS